MKNKIRFWINTRNLFTFPGQRIKAFTLIELTVVMLISGILFGIAYVSLQILQGRYRAFAVATEKLLAVDQAAYWLNRDFLRATAVHVEGERIRFTLDSTEVTYRFYPEYFLRQQQQLLDTFPLVCGERKMYLLGQPVVGSQGLMDELTFRGECQQEVFLFHGRKEYDARQLTEYEQSLKTP